MTLHGHWFVRVAVWAYNLGHGADVDQSHAGPREQTLLVRAQDPREALEKAILFTDGILCSPFVWQARITELRQGARRRRGRAPGPAVRHVGEEAVGLEEVHMLTPETLPTMWKIIICIPDLNLDYYMASETKPTQEQIQAMWEAGGSKTVLRPPGWKGPLADAYPAVARVEKLEVYRVR